MFTRFTNYQNKFLGFYQPKVHHLFYAGKPILLVNSIQKAGTHMLTNALAKSLPLKYSNRGVYNHSLVQLWPENKSDRNTSSQVVIDFLSYEAWPGEVLRGHIEYDRQLAMFLEEKNIPHIFIVRQPLDVLLSLANWWERHNEVPVIPFLTYKQISKPEDRMMFLLTGKWKSQQVWPDFITRYNQYVGWLKDPNCLVVRYEDLLLAPKIEAQRIADFMPVNLNKKVFIKELGNKDNRTFTKSTDKVFALLSSNVLEQYENLGGANLERSFGYSV